VQATLLRVRESTVQGDCFPDSEPARIGAGPMMICTAPPSMGLAIMLRCGDSPATTLRVSASLIAP
jgi:hypothetical protein